MGRQDKLPEVLTEEEQKAILEQPNSRYPTGERNYVMIKLMLNTGLRLSETTSLKWKHIDLTSGKLMVREGKGAKDRTLWIGEDMIDTLCNWKERQVEDIGSCDYVFTTLEGNPVQNRYVQQLVKRLADKANIDKSISPHTFRNTFATDLYRETGKIRLVQKALGHSDLSNTMIYTHIVDEELEDSMKNLLVE